MATIESSPYDNDTTLLYKWAAFFDIPVYLVIIHPRTSQDSPTTPGNDNYVYEPITQIIATLASQGKDAAEMYDNIIGYNIGARDSDITPYSGNIRDDDIAMAYYGMLRTTNPDIDLSDIMNQFYRTMNDNITYDMFDGELSSRSPLRNLDPENCR